MLKTVIFDIDDTLYSFKKVNKIAMKAFYDYCGKHFGWPEEKTIKLHQRCMDEQQEILGFHNASIHNRMIRFQMMLEAEGIPIFPHVRKMYKLVWNTTLDLIRPFPGVIEYMKYLKKEDIRIGIATDMTTYIQYEKLDRLGVIPYLDFVVTSEEAGYEKPHELFFKLCLKKAGCEAEECLMIGDNWNKDIIGAKEAGMHYAWYQQEEPQGDIDEEKKRHLILDYKELMADTEYLRL